MWNSCKSDKYRSPICKNCEAKEIEIAKLRAEIKELNAEISKLNMEVGQVTDKYYRECLR